MAVAAPASGSYGSRRGRAACGAFAVAVPGSGSYVSRRGTSSLRRLFGRGACLRFVRIVRGRGSLRRLDCRGAQIVPFVDNVVAKARCCLSFRRRPPFQQPLTGTEERIVPTLPQKIGRRRIGAIRARRPGRRSCRRRSRPCFRSRLRSRLARFGHYLANCIFKRQALVGDVRLQERGLVRPQCHDVGALARYFDFCGDWRCCGGRSGVDLRSRGGNR